MGGCRRGGLVTVARVWDGGGRAVLARSSTTSIGCLEPPQRLSERVGPVRSSLEMDEPDTWDGGWRVEGGGWSVEGGRWWWWWW